MKSTMADITDSTNIAQAFSYFPIAWATGSTIGPLLSAVLIHPAERFPKLFGSWTFFKTFPYFLACIIPSVYAFVAVLVTHYFLREVRVINYPLHDVQKRNHS